MACYDLPSLQSVSTPTDCSVCAGNGDFTLPSKTCVKQVTIGDVTVKIEYSLWNDILYIKSASPSDTVFTIKFVGKDESSTISSTGGELTGKILEIPYGTTSVEISANVPVSGSLLEVSIASLSLGWNGRIKTGILNIEVTGGVPSSAEYLDIDELGMRTIEVDDPADLCGLHVKLKTSTGWVDKYYAFTGGKAVITWDAEALMIPPSVTISEKGTIRVVYDDESVYLFHEGGPIMDSPVKIDIVGDFAYLDGTPTVLKKSATLEKCKDVGGCWTARLDQIAPPSDSVLTKLMLEYEIGGNKTSAVVFPSQDALRNALSSVGIWSSVFAEVLDVDLEKATFEVKTTTLGDYEAPAQGSFLNVLFLKYYTKDSKYGAIVRGRGSNYSIFPTNPNVEADIVQMKYDSEKKTFEESQRIVSATLYTNSITSNGTFAVDVNQNPDGNLYAIKLDGNYGSYPISFTSLGIVALLYDPKEGKIEPVIGKGTNTVKDANGNVLGMVSDGIAYVFFGTLPDGKVVVPVAAWLDGNQISGEDSQAPFTVIMEVRYSPTSIVSVDSSGKLNSLIPVAMLSSDGPVAAGQTLDTGLYRLIAPVALDAELLVVYMSDGQYKITKLTTNTLGSGTATLGSIVKIVFTSSNTDALTSDAKNVINSIVVVKVETPSFYYNYAKELTLTQLETEGINIYKLILLFSQISRIHEANVSVVGLFIGEPGIGFITNDKISIDQPQVPPTVDVPYLNINGGVINVENVSTAVNSGYSVTVEFIPMLVPSGSSINAVKSVTITRSNTSVDISDVANDIISNLAFLTSDYFIIRLVVSNETSEESFITDEYTYRLLEDSGLVNVSVVGTNLSVTVSSSLSGITVVVKDKEGNIETPSSGTTIQFEPPYMIVEITPTSSLGSGIYIIVISQSTIVETPSVKVVRALDGSIVIETSNLENVEYYYLDPDGNLTQTTSKVDKPGIYIVKGTYRGLSGDVDYAAAIAVPGYAIVPTADGLEITVLSLDEATLEVKTYPAYVAILNAAGLDLMAQTYTVKGRYFKTEVSGDAVDIKLCCCGECTTYSGVRKDKIVMTYAPIAAAGAVVALIKLASR